MASCICWLITFICGVAAAASASQHSAGTAFVSRTQAARNRLDTSPVIEFGASLALRQATSNSDGSNDNNDDNGWGTAASDKSKMERELAVLKSDISSKQPSSFVAPGAGNSKVVEEGRDLFIPILTLVSIAGFTGLYGYESLRLYHNGELYLPF